METGRAGPKASWEARRDSTIITPRPTRIYTTWSAGDVKTDSKYYESIFAETNDRHGG